MKVRPGRWRSRGGLPVRVGSPWCDPVCAGNVYPGSVDRTGHFSTLARVDGGNYSISITGQFSANGFDATVQVQQMSPSCGYQVHWVGSKSGSPNTFP